METPPTHRILRVIAACAVIASLGLMAAGCGPSGDATRRGGPSKEATAPMPDAWPRNCQIYLKVVEACADRLNEDNPAAAVRLRAANERLTTDWANSSAHHVVPTVNGMDCTTATSLFTRVEVHRWGCAEGETPVAPAPTQAAVSMPPQCDAYLTKVQACIDRLSASRPGNAAMLARHKREVIDNIAYALSHDAHMLPTACTAWLDLFTRVDAVTNGC